MKKINEAGIKFSMRTQDEQPYGGSTWETSKKQLMSYYVMVGVMVDDSEGIDSKSFKGYERFNSYTQSYVKILSMYPKNGGEKYNYIVKGMIGVAEERSDDELKFAARNSIAKILNDLGIYPMTSSSEFPCKILKAGDDDNGVSKEMRPRGKEFNESKKHTIRLTESQLKSIITESIKKALKESGMDDYLVIRDLVINGKNVIDRFGFRYGTHFRSKYDFKTALTEFAKKIFGINVYDVDLAYEFDEENDRIYVDTNSEGTIEAYGSYSGGDYEDIDDDIIL